MSRCVALKRDGSACKVQVHVGGQRCRWHDESDDGRRRHREESRRGGLSKAYSALTATAPIADVVDVDTLDLSTPAGVMTLLGATLRQLARLPLDVRTANAIAQVATAQRQAIETAALASRLEALEASARGR